MLEAGVKDFQENVFPKYASLFGALASSQRPHTLFITCCDSRIDPSLITQTKPGELFVSRNAGNIVPPFNGEDCATSSAIEFAVVGLRVSSIVICGHSDCGAMKALNDPCTESQFPLVHGWIQRSEVKPGKNKITPLDELIQTNITQQVSNLKTYPFVVKAIEAGDLSISGWRYDIGTGQIDIIQTEGAIR